MTEATPAEPITQEEIDAAKPAVREQAKALQPRGGKPMANLIHATAETQAALLQAFPPDRIVSTLERMMEATVTVVRGRGENAVQMEVPDNRTQIEGAKLMLAYTLGKPVERAEIVNVNLNADSEIGLADRLLHSPAMRTRLKQMIEAAEKSAAVPV